MPCREDIQEALTMTSWNSKTKVFGELWREIEASCKQQALNARCLSEPCQESLLQPHSAFK